MRFPKVLIFLFLFPGLLTSCQPGGIFQPDLRASVEKSYTDWVSEDDARDPDLSPWYETYHPVIYFAWVWKGRQPLDRDLENRLRELNEIYWNLDDELSAQIAEGKSILDKEGFLGMIDDETTRQSTLDLIDEGVPAIYAFARASIEPLLSEHNDLPEQILRLLGKLYKTRNDLLDVPAAQPVIDDDSKWRDWLQAALAASGEDGVRAILDWDSEIESLQDIVPDEPFWDGRLTHALTLRPIQLARSAALHPLLSKLEPYHNGGEVSDFDKWIYWNLAKTAWDIGGMYPYTDEDVPAIVDLLITNGILNGPMGDGEEAAIIADALVRSPSTEWIFALFQIADSQVTLQERRDLCFRTIAGMLQTPGGTWLPDSDSVSLLKDRVLEHLDDRSLVNNPELIEFYNGILMAFGSAKAREIGVGLDHEDMIRIHDNFIALLPTITESDERAAALGLFTWGIMQPDFVAQLEYPSPYFEQLMEIYVDWGATTTFDNPEISEAEFGILYRHFGRILGFGIPWEIITGEDSE